MDITSPLPQRTRTSHARVGLIVTALIVLAAGWIAVKSSAFQWFLVRASLRGQFPQVQWISTRDLAALLEDRERRPLLLLDVRTPEEWNVSHLPGARRVDPGASVESALAEVSREMPVVTYCAVGYRSGDLANRLSAAGFTNVQNLDGGIFQWANEQRPLVRESEPVTRVHPYNEYWGRLLRDDVRGSL